MIKYIHNLANRKTTEYSAKATHLAHVHPNYKDYRKWSYYEMKHYFWLWVYLKTK